MEQKLQRFGPLGAVLGIALVFLSFVAHGRWASTEESAQEIADLYVQNQDRVFMGSWLAVLGGFACLCSDYACRNEFETPVNNYLGCWSLVQH